MGSMTGPGSSVVGSSIDVVSFQSMRGLNRWIELKVVVEGKGLFSDGVLVVKLTLAVPLPPAAEGVAKRKLGRPISTTPASVVHELTT